MNAKTDCDVLVIGAGPVGLSLATELTLRGHTVRVVEKNARVGVQPRAKTTNVRTMTHMRRWGLAAEMRQKSPLSDDFPRRVVFQTGLFDPELHAFENAFCASPEKDSRFPEHAEFIPQYVVENILLDSVTSHPLSSVGFDQKFIDFTRDEDGVTTRIAHEGSDDIEEVRSKYIVGADGGRSTVRDLLNIDMHGQRNMTSFVTLILKIPGLKDDPDLHPALFHWIIDEAAPCFIGPMDTGDIWFWAKVVEPGVDDDNETLLSVVHTAIGKDYPAEVIARDEWTVHSLLAERYREKRAFLVGDACHLHSPFGGHGMNQGVSDAVDLGWKLSAALQGWGTDALLQSYEYERSQAHRAVVKSATENVGSLSDQFIAPDLKLDTPAGEAARAKAKASIAELKAPEFHSLGLVLGYNYDGSPIVQPEDGPVLPITVCDYKPSARPGWLAPHLWLENDVSLYDLFGLGYTLLRIGVEDKAAETQITEAASDNGIPLSIISPAHSELPHLFKADYVLIRPDQHVAWRGNQLPSADILTGLMRGNGYPINK